MSTTELKELVASLVIAQKETDRQLRATDVQMQETDRKMQETDRMIKELGRQIGGLGNKFGSFTEGLAFGSISRILRSKFRMETIVPSVSIRRGHKEQEFDILAYSNGSRNEGVVVEVKSPLDMRAVEQIRAKMADLFVWLPEHSGKAFVVLVGFVKAHADARRAALAEGWYLAEVGDDLFRMVTPKGFKPRRYRHP
ncbi:MAG: hypothetical protein MUF04_05585 [Akkermansiaceae bacterium]|nr:hypothetical protein [Akkermansiaceae bacterium]